MALTVAVEGDLATELCSAHCFSYVLDWVASRPRAEENAYNHVLAVMPLDFRYAEDVGGITSTEAPLGPLLRELAELRRQAGEREPFATVLERWLTEAQAASDQSRALVFP